MVETKEYAYVEVEEREKEREEIDWQTGGQWTVQSRDSLGLCSSALLSPLSFPHLATIHHPPQMSQFLTNQVRVLLPSFSQWDLLINLPDHH